jgi:hypothetical protein
LGVKKEHPKRGARIDAELEKEGEEALEKLEQKKKQQQQNHHKDHHHPQHPRESGQGMG